MASAPRAGIALFVIVPPRASMDPLVMKVGKHTLLIIPADLRIPLGLKKDIVCFL